MQRIKVLEVLVTGVMEMRGSKGLLALFLMAAVVLSLAAHTRVGWADDEEDDDGDEIQFEEANIFLELNDTDGDLGIQALVDGDAWKRLEIEDPNELEILAVRSIGSLRQQGLTELFFESDEPSFDELLPEEFLLRFPEGKYEIEGITLEGLELESTDELTHVLPAPPENIFISGEPAAEDCDVEPLPSVEPPVIISWDPVTESHPEIGRDDPAIEIVGYQVVVEREEPTLLVFSVDLPPDVTEIAIPEEFIALGEEFKLEIVAREESGNQTAVETCSEVE